MINKSRALALRQSLDRINFQGLDELFVPGNCVSIKASSILLSSYSPSEKKYAFRSIVRRTGFVNREEEVDDGI